VSDGWDLEDLEKTPSGILLPPREEMGPPIVQLEMDGGHVPFNVALDHRSSMQPVRELAELIATRQHALSQGLEVSPIELREHHFGYTWLLTPYGISRVLAVVPGHAQKVDPRVLLWQAAERRKLEKQVERQAERPGGARPLLVPHR
jgi:hypothetical protein